MTTPAAWVEYAAAALARERERPPHCYELVVVAKPVPSEDDYWAWAFCTLRATRGRIDDQGPSHP